MRLSISGLPCWKRHVEVGQDPALRHQRDDIVNVRVGIDVMQPHPYAEFAQGLAQVLQAGFQRAAIPEAGAVFSIHAVGAGVLRYHQQLPHPGAHQALGLLHDIADGAAHQVTAHGGDDAETAAMVTTFGDFEVGIVARCQLHALGWYQVREGIVHRRVGHVLVHRADHFLVGGGAGHAQHLRVQLHDGPGIVTLAHAAGNDHATVFADGLADGVEGFLLGAVDEAAGVHHHDLGVLVAGDDLVAVDLQLGEDALGIDQCLGAAQADKTDLVGGAGLTGHDGDCTWDGPRAGGDRAADYTLAARIRETGIRGVASPPCWAIVSGDVQRATCSGRVQLHGAQGAMRMIISTGRLASNGTI